MHFRSTCQPCNNYLPTRKQVSANASSERKGHAECMTEGAYALIVVISLLLFLRYPHAFFDVGAHRDLETPAKKHSAFTFYCFSVYGDSLFGTHADYLVTKKLPSVLNRWEFCFYQNISSRLTLLRLRLKLTFFTNFK